MINKSIIVTKNEGGVSSVPTNKEELIKSIIGMKKEGDQNLEKIMEKDSKPLVAKEDKGTVNDIQTLADQIKSNNLIPIEKDKDKESINLDDVKNGLHQSEFQSIHSEKANYVFSNGWEFLGEVENDKIENGVEGLLKSPSGDMFDVKYTQMAGTNMGVMNDFFKKKVFFVNFDSKTVTPSA